MYGMGEKTIVQIANMFRYGTHIENMSNISGQLKVAPEQVEDFYPTPGSLSTTIYYTDVNPLTNEKV